MVEKESVFKGDEVMLMLERMQDGISIIAEQHTDLKEGQEKLRSEMQSGQEKLRSEMQSGQEKLRGDMNEGFKKLRGDMNEGFKKVDERFDSVFEFLSNIEDELVDLRKEINILKETKADDERVMDLDKRLIAIERQVNAM